MLFAGGGTGGHVYPSLAIAEALAADPSFAPLRLSYVGTRSGLEAQIVPKAGLPLAFISAAPLRRNPLALARAALFNLMGVLQSLAILHRVRPDAVIATGGYVAFPLVAAVRIARLLRLTTARAALLELNAVPGLANRMSAPLVDEIWLGVAPRGRSLGRKETVTGTPVRQSFARDLGAEEARAALGLAPNRPTVVVIGGSQGARRLNDAAAAMLADGVPGWQVLHVSGEREREVVERQEAPAVARGDAKVVGYLDDPRAAYAAADVMVARAGASTLGELAAAGTPAILVPYPFAADDHQRHNAEALAATGAARVVADRDLDGARLFAELQAALEPATLAAMRAAAARRRAGDARELIRARVKRWRAANVPVP